jgi:hypothetical protein
MRIKLMIQPCQEEEDDDLDEILSEMKEQIHTIHAASEKIETQVMGLYTRAASETIEWMHEPLRPTPPVKAWCVAHSLPDTPTIDEFTDACFRVAQSLDYETRMLTFRRVDAEVLWQGQQRLTIYEVIAKIPRLFL